VSTWKDFQIPLHVDSHPPHIGCHLKKDSLFVQCAGLKLQSVFLNLQSYRQLVVDQMLLWFGGWAGPRGWILLLGGILQILRENTQNPQSISSDQSLVLIPIDAIPNIHERKREFKKRNKRASLSYQISKNTQTQSLSERERKTTTVGRKVIQFSGKSWCYHFKKFLNKTISCCPS
jgi:hypothetical protein